MFKNKFESGFSLIELLVALLILGLITGLVAPNAFAWLDSRKSASMRSEVTSSLALLPLQARLQGTKLTIATERDLNIQAERGITVSFEPALVVLPNGYCKSSNMRVLVDGKTYNYQVQEPYCDVSGS